MRTFATSDPTSTWRLETFGTLSLSRHDDVAEPRRVSGATKPIALLAYLAAQPRRRASRERLADLLWRGRTEELALQSLRQAISHLRRLLGPAAFEGEGDLQLTIPLTSDREDFLSAIAADRLDVAAALYHGDFIPAHVLPDARGFEEWVDLERRRLRLAFVEAVTVLLRQTPDAALADQHVQWAARARDTDLTDEHGWRLLLEVHLRRGQRASAALEAAALRAVADREARVLSRSTLTLLEATAAPTRPGVVDRTVAASPDPLAQGPDLVGRANELTQLVAAWREAQERRVLLHLSAPSGLGKTRLLDAFAARLRVERVVAIRLAGSVADRGIALGGLAELVSALQPMRGAAGIAPAYRRVLAEIQPGFGVERADETRTVTRDDGPRHQMLAIRDLIAAVAAERPLVVLIDDWHWVDLASRRLFDAALAALAHAPILVVTAGRPGDATTANGLTGARAMALAALDRDDTEALLSSVAPLPPAPWAAGFLDRLHAAAQGSPLEVIGWLRLALAQGILQITSEGWRTTDPSALEQLLATGQPIARRVAARSAAEQQVLLAMATARVPFTGSMLAALGATDVAAVLERDGLLAVDGSQVRLAHQSIADAVLSVASPSAVRDAHRQLAHLLRGSREDRFQRAHLRHAVHAADRVEIRRSLPRLIDQHRRLGDRRALTALVADLAGVSDPDAARALVALLPRAVRWGLDSMARRAGALVIGLALANLSLAAALATPSSDVVPQAVDARLSAVAVGATSAPFSAMVALHAPSWPDDSSLTTQRWAGPVPFPKEAMIAQSAPSRRGPPRWVVPVQVADSGITDLFLVTPAGDAERLTFAAGDDVQPDWSPDGRQIAFATSRDSRLGRSDIAVLDLASRTTRRLTTGDAWEESPRWLPDGSAVGYIQRYDDGRPARVCRARLIDAVERCAPIGVAASRLILVGFLSPDAALVSVDDRLYLHDSRAGRAVLVDTTPGVPQRSPDGHWLVTQDASGHLLIAPTVRPMQRRRLALAERSDRHLFWWPVESGRAPRERRRIGPPGVQVVTGVPLRLAAVDESGAPLSERWPMRWAVDDTTNATIDSVGELRTRRAGRLAVTLVPVGAAPIRDTFDVRAPSERLLLRESWEQLDTLHWLPFGRPRPVLLGAGASRAFYPNGDGVFSSGVFQRVPVAAAEGLAIEADVMTPITGRQWQAITIAITTGVDAKALAAWDRGDAFPLSGRFAPESLCEFTYPSTSEGAGYGNEFVGAQVRRAATTAMRTGARYRVRVQLFPDGQCGVAIDGQVVGVTRRPIRLAGAARVYLFGSSVGTAIRVGPTRVWSGVPGGVRWDAAP